MFLKVGEQALLGRLRVLLSVCIVLALEQGARTPT